MYMYVHSGNDCDSGIAMDTPCFYTFVVWCIIPTSPLIQWNERNYTHAHAVTQNLEFMCKFGESEDKIVPARQVDLLD